MHAKMLVSSIALIGGMALAMPVFAQTQSQQNPGTQPAMNSQMMSGQEQAQNEQPMMRHRMHRHFRHARIRHEPRYGEGNGPGQMGARYGTDVAPGGGVYTRQDVASEAPGRMSHPGVGSPRAPSAVAKGSLAHVNRVENAETARLNMQQLNGNGSQTATLPNNE